MLNLSQKKLLTKVVKFQAEVLCLSKLITFWLDMGAAESTLPHFNRVKVRDVLRNLTPFVKFKKRGNTHRGVILLVKHHAEACDFTKSYTPPCLFFHVF